MSLCSEDVVIKKVDIVWSIISLSIIVISICAYISWRNKTAITERIKTVSESIKQTFSSNINQEDEEEIIDQPEIIIEEHKHVHKAHKHVHKAHKHVDEVHTK